MRLLTGLLTRRRLTLGLGSALLLPACAPAPTAPDRTGPRPVIRPAPDPRPGTGPEPRPSRDGDRPVTGPRPTPGGNGDRPTRPGRITAQPGAEGTVRNRAGRPLGGVFVQAKGVGPGAPTVPELAVFTDPSGFWRWDLPPGRYRLTFTLEGYPTTMHQIQVLAARTVRLDVVLG
jgi:hypothetical protein